MNMDEGAKAYTELPAKTREFIEDLREEDVALLRDGIRLVLALRTTSKFMKWVILSLIGAFITLVLLAEKIAKVVSWVRSLK